MTHGGAALRLAAAAAVLGAGLVTSGPPAAAGSGNMLRGDSASFDSSAGGWTSTTGALSVDHSTKHSGTGSLLVKPRVAVNLGSIVVRSDPLPALPGKVYSGTFWATSATIGTEVNASLSFVSATGQVLPSVVGAVRSVGGNWVRLSGATAIAPQRAKTVQLVAQIDNPQFTTAVHIDDASVIADGTPPAPNVRAMRVRRHRLVDQSGNPVRLHGITRVGLEQSSTNGLTAADAAAFKAWGVNVVRLPLSPSYWLRSGCAYDPNYRRRVASVVRMLSVRRIATMLELFTTTCAPNGKPPMPARSLAVPFWKQVAHRFRGNPLVTFDLFNEPHEVTQHQWLRGGQIRWDGSSYRAIGMQGLYNVVRSTGARNVVFIAGLGWGSNPPTRYVRGRGIVYAAHAYTCPINPPPKCQYPHNPNSANRILRDWLPLSRHHPVMLNEFGWPQTTDPGRFMSSALRFCRRQHWSWAAYGFDGSVGDHFDLVGAKLSDGTYEPSPIGMPVLRALARS